MNDDILNWVFACRVRGNAKLVLLTMALRADAEGICCPSIDLLATETGFSDRTVQRHIQALERAGFIMVERSSGWHRPSRYVLRVAAQQVRP